MDVWQGGLVDIGSEDSAYKISIQQAQGTEVLVIALVVVIWFVIIAIFLLRWNRKQQRNQMRYRCIAQKQPLTHCASPSSPKEVLVRHAHPLPVSRVRTCSDHEEEEAHLVSEIELNDLPDNTDAFNI